MNLSKELTKLKSASRELTNLNELRKNELLGNLALNLVLGKEEILAANRRDLAQMSESDPLYDRLLLNSSRIDGLASMLGDLKKFSADIDETLYHYHHPQGMEIRKVRVPLGVVAVIYEARPNVTLDVFALAFKAGNACALKGSQSAYNTNASLVKIIKQTLIEKNINPDIVYLLPAERSYTDELLQASDFVDVVIPRGSQTLIEYVRKNSLVPVIETGAGVVHIYIDESADLEIAEQVTTNSKTRRPSVCNSLDTLLVHEKQVDNLVQILAGCLESGVIIKADEASHRFLGSALDSEQFKLLQRAKAEDFGHEHLSLTLTLKVVADLAEALAHIEKYSSKHSEAVVAQDERVISTFLEAVDSASVYANVATAFTDGFEFGLGSEIGISTQKLHARGPFGLKELTSYKWIIVGNGQTRKKS